MNGRRLDMTMCALLAAGIALQACTDKDSTDTAEGSVSAPVGPQQIRGTVQSVDATSITVLGANGVVHVGLPASTPVAAVVQSDRAHIAEGSFLGIGSATQPDGSQRAVEVTVFPEALRGTGEGSYPWSHPAASGGNKMTNGTASSLKMTNGTVASSRMTNGTVSSQQGSASLTLTYNDGKSKGSQTITIPPDVPIVTLEAATTSDLQPGAHVIVFATRDDAGALTAARVLVGKNGLVPPQ